MNAIQTALKLSFFLVFFLLISCSFRWASDRTYIHQFAWTVQGGGDIGRSVKFWLVNLPPTESLDLVERKVIIEAPTRRRRSVSFNASGSAVGFLQETVSKARVEDDQGHLYGTLRLFAFRYYEDSEDSVLLLARLNKEMDDELARRLQGWLQIEDFMQKKS